MGRFGSSGLNGPLVGVPRIIWASQVLRHRSRIQMGRLRIVAKCGDCILAIDKCAEPPDLLSGGCDIQDKTATIRQLEMFFLGLCGPELVSCKWRVVSKLCPNSFGN